MYKRQVYNGAFPDSYISMKNTEYTDSYSQDALSLYLVTASICGGNFDLMEHAVDLLSESDMAYREALDTLKSVDFSKVDMLSLIHIFLGGCGDGNLTGIDAGHFTVCIHFGNLFI